MAQPQIMNSAKTFVVDALRGALAGADDLAWHSEPGFATRRGQLPPRQVALLSGGGSGHEPLHTGFIGQGMLTGSCPGLIFTSPNALAVRAATECVDAGGGVLHIVKNYTGDVLNFTIAANLAGEDGIAVEQVLVDDDVASESDDGPGRRGTAATIVVEKICGAAADRGDALEVVAQLGRRVARGARTMAVALRPCTLPGAQEPSFDLPPGQIEIGIGIHGERGTERVPAMPASELVRRLADPVIDALGLGVGEPVIAVVNGLGGTPLVELQLLAAELADYLADKEIAARRILIGNFVTALNMEGASITLVRSDDEILELWDAPTAAPGWPNAAGHEFEGVAERSEVQFNPPVTTHDDGREIDGRPNVWGGLEVGRWIGDFVQRVLSEEPHLTDLDRRAGDGDFGNNMLAALDHVDVEGVRRSGSPAAVFENLSDVYLGYAGGTSGALFGIWFRQFFRVAGEGIDLQGVAVAARKGLKTIGDLGGAQPGDKTMIDAIDPAVRSLERDAEAGAGLLEALASAASAAADGARGTADITARRGRASYVGESSRGVVDPGALVISWFFEAAAGAGHGEVVSKAR